MLQANNLNKSYGSRLLLSDVSFFLSKGQKIALVGSNGTGKTTLLKIIAGLESPDSGEIEISKDICIGYLQQDTSLVGDQNIAEYLRRVTGIDTLEERIQILSSKLDEPSALSEYGEVHERYERLNGYAFEHRMEIMLSGFGLEKIDLTRPLSSLSSGQKSKVSLAGILLKGVDLLLLDEPTNNLDLPALIWLEDFLRKSSAACIMVSHDRQFLDRVVRKIFELDSNTHTLNISGGTYSDYLETKAKSIIRQKQEYESQQKEITRLSDQAHEKRLASDRGGNWEGTDNDKFLRGFKRNRAGKSGKAAAAIEKRIEQMDPIGRPIERESLEIPLAAEVISGNVLIRLIDVYAGYPDVFTIGPISFEARFGNRVGIMGLNGSGKSTLLKTITGQLPQIQGSVEIGSGVVMGNMMQEHESLPRDTSLLEFLMSRTKLDLSESYAKLKRFGFDELQVKHAISTLSPGGRARLLLALFSAQSVNTLILDEPTNHLDLEVLDALETTLETYKGTVVLVSHDRYFLEKAKLDYTYTLSEGIFTKISDYKEYVSQAEKRATELLKSL